MAKLLLLLVSMATFLFVAQALDCGLKTTRSEKLRDTLIKCLRNNKTLEDMWDMTSSEESSESATSEQAGAEPEPVVPDNSKILQSLRAKRASSYMKSELAVEENLANSTEIGNGNNDEQQKDFTPEEMGGENCMIQCVFQSLKMTDTDGYPEHDKLLESLLMNATGREFRDFLQDSTDECFQEMEKENQQDTCSYSNKLVSCMADKGKTNCADWPVGNFQFV